VSPNGEPFGRIAALFRSAFAKPSTKLPPPPMSPTSDKYADFVDHPRYGRGPNITGLNPSPAEPNVHLHWNTSTQQEIISRYEAIIGEKWPHGKVHSGREFNKRIPNTAIAADLAKQTAATMQVTHYFDLERSCRDCNRPFIFFAREQKYWYEQLGFGLDSDCVRCVDCRKQQQGIDRQRELYESLFHIADKTEQQTLEMASACLYLMEKSVFSTRQTERVRMLFNSIPTDAKLRKYKRFTDLLKRLIAVEAKLDERQD
jgi:hypothetical protein